MRLSVRRIVGLAVALALTVPGAASARQAARHRHRVISAMNGFSLFQSPQPHWGPQLEAMESDGVQVVRSDAMWAYIQPRAPTGSGPGYRWSMYDAWVTALASHHLTWEPIIDYWVVWPKTCPGLPVLSLLLPTPCPPANLDAFSSFAAAVAARYGDHGSFWAQHSGLPYLPVRIFEIWNEENNSNWYVAPARYASLFARASSAISAVDPQASVIIGGLAERGAPSDPGVDYPSSYVDDVFAADPGLRGHVDGFGLHPYGATAADVEQWIVDFRRTLDSHSEAWAPIDVTEFGWTTGGPSRAGWRASMMRAVARTLSRSNCGIRLLAPYDWINPGSSRADDFGLVDASGGDTTLRPAGIAWFKGLRRAARLPELRLCGSVPS